MSDLFARDGGIDRERDPVEFGRLLTLSDSVFAIAMTLLVISIAVPAGLPSAGFRESLAELVPKFGFMAISIMVVASAWLAHHRLFALLQRADGGLVGLNIVALGLVAFIPFPHALLGNYPAEPLAYVVYAVVLAAVNGVATAMDVHVRRAELLRVPLGEEAFRREVVRGLVPTVVFIGSIPLAFVLGGFTPLVWIALLPLDRLIARWTPRTTG